MYGYNNPRATPPMTRPAAMTEYSSPSSWQNNNNNNNNNWNQQQQWNNPSSSPSSPRVNPPTMPPMGMNNLDLNSGMGMGMNNNMGMGGMGGGMGMPVRKQFSDPSQYSSQGPAVNKPYQAYNNYNTSDNLDVNSANMKSVNVNVNLNYNQGNNWGNNAGGYNSDLEMKKMGNGQGMGMGMGMPMSSLAYRSTAFSAPAIPSARGDTQFDGVAPETFNGMQQSAFSGAGLYKSGVYEEHASGGTQYLRDAVLGVNDGLVSLLLLTLGLSGGNLTNTQILLAGITGALGGAISMALGEYIATKSQSQVTAAELKLEKEHLAYHRDAELAEVRTFMQELNLEGDLLEKCVQAINSRDEAMIRLMMAFEFGFQEELERNPLKAMLFSGALFLTGSLPAVLPYAVTNNNTTALAISISLSAMALFGIGAGKTKLTKGPWFFDGMENLILGSLGGAATFGLGKAYGSGNRTMA